MLLRQRTSANIRRDAIRMAVQKANAGCLACAQSYFKLAKQHGSSEEEIAQAIEKGARAGGKGISRRDMLKLAAGVVVGVALGADVLAPRRAEAASAYYWGTDSNSATCCNLPQNFYIGRFGYGTTGSTLFFNTSAAQAAGKSGTYIYWGLVGPAIRPKKTTPYNWGVKQADTAIKQWSSNANAQYVGGTTIFADIETGFGGWKGGNSRFYNNNQQVVQGYLDTIAGNSSPAFHPGIYITLNDWGYFFGTAFRPTQTFVLWIAGCFTCGSQICAPCPACSSTESDVENLLQTSVGNTILGGSQMVLWQYWISNCSCGDFNVAVQNPALGFTPVSSSTTYNSGC